MWLKVFTPPEGLTLCPSLASILQLSSGLHLPSPHNTHFVTLIFIREMLDISIAFIQLSQMQLFIFCIYSIHLCKLWIYIRLSSSQRTQSSAGLRACKLTLLLGGLISCRVRYFYCDALGRTYSYLLERQKCKLISEAATEAAEDSHGDVVSASNYHSFSPPFGFPFQSSMSTAVDKLMEMLVFFCVHMPWHLCRSLL